MKTHDEKTGAASFVSQAMELIICLFFRKNAMGEEAKPETVEEMKFAHGIVSGEVRYRRDKRWQIFSWASTVLVAVTGGVISIQRQDALGFGQRLALTCAVALLSLQSVLWCYEQAESERELKKKLELMNKSLKVPSLTPMVRIRFVGLIVTLIVLTAVAILAIWLQSIPSKLPHP